MLLSPNLLRARLARTKDNEKRLLLQKSLFSQLSGCLNNYVEELQTTAQEHTQTGYQRGIAWSQYWIGLHRLQQGALQESMSLFLTSIESATAANDDDARASALTLLAVAKHERGEYLDALFVAFEAADIFDRIKKFSGRAHALNGIARTYLSLSDFTSALQYGLQGLDCARKSGSKEKEAMLLHELAEIELAIGTYDSALRYIEECIHLHEEIDDLPGIAPALGLQGLICERMGKDVEAIALLQRSLELNVAINSHIGVTYSHLNLAALFHKVRDPLAVNYATTALELSERYQIKNVSRASLIGLGYIAKDEGDLQKAKCLLLRSLNMIEGNEAVDHRIEILEGLVEVSKRQNDLQSMALYRQMLSDAKLFQAEQQHDRRIQVIEVRTQVSRVEYERELYRAKAQQAAQSAEEHARELSMTITSLTERRGALYKLRKELEAMSAEYASDIRVRNMLRDIDCLLAADEPATKARALISNIEPEFPKQLSSTYPQLSKAEVSVCLFLKAGLRSVDIANILKTSERTVENHRAHIRKKLGLPQTASIKTALDAVRAT